MKNLVLHALVFHKPAYKSKDEARRKAHDMFPKEKIKKFVRETKSSFRFRVHPKQHFDKTTFVSKRFNKDITAVFGIPNERLKGGAVSAEDTQKFIESSYKSKDEAEPNIDGFDYDKELSNDTAKVYHDKDSNKTIVVNRGTKGAKDWVNNAKYGFDVLTHNVFNTYGKSDRYKEAETTQRNAIQKYGKVDENIGHSQGAVITRKLNDKGLTQEVININPATYYEKPKKNEHNYRSTFDPVSMFNTGATTIKDYTLNPLKAHSTSFLNKLNPKYLLGKGKIINKNNIYNNIYTNNMSDWIMHVKDMADKMGINYRDALRHPKVKELYRKMKGGMSCRSGGRGGKNRIRQANDWLDFGETVVKKAIPLAREIKGVIGGAVRSSDIKHLSNRSLKELLKERGMKLTNKVDGKYKPFTKDQMINLLQKDKRKNVRPKTALEKMAYTSAPQEFDDAPASNPEYMQDADSVVSEIARLVDLSSMPKVEKDEIDDLISLLKKLTGGRIIRRGGKANLKKAYKWLDFSEKAVKKAIPLAQEIKSSFF